MEREKPVNHDVHDRIRILHVHDCRQVDTLWIVTEADRKGGTRIVGADQAFELTDRWLDLLIMEISCWWYSSCKRLCHLSCCSLLFSKERKEGSYDGHE